MLTVRAIDSLQNGKLIDPTRTGLAIEVVGRKKVWRYARRVAGAGTVIRRSLGPWPAYDIAAARKWADELNAKVVAGIDPRVAEQAAQAACMTVEAAHDLYMVDIQTNARMALKARTIADKQSIWLRDLAPHIGLSGLQTVTPDDLWNVVEAKGRTAPVRANRLAAEAKVFFAWCVSRAGQRTGIRLAANPALSLNGKHYEESKGRTRFLSDDEIGWLLVALAGEVEPLAARSYRRAFLLMLLTGARIGEVKNAPAAEYVDGVWTISGNRTKNGDAHSIHLGAWGRILAESKGEWMIPHPNGGMIDSEIWYEVRDRLHRRMEEAAGRKLALWTPHDLRRTLRSNTFSLGIRYEVAEAMLNHRKQGLERRYDLADLSDQMAEGFAAWEQKVMRIADKLCLDGNLDMPKSLL
jgi:integrase